MVGLRRAGHRADGQARRGRSVHHEPGRRLAPLHPGHDARRAVPGALRAVRVADRQRRSHRRSAAIRSPGCSRATWRSSAKRSAEFPYAATSYRLTEHFHFWTKHVRVNAVMQPEFFVEISEELAAEKGHRQGRLGAGLVEARLDQGQGGGDQADQAADLRRQDRPYRRHSAALGLHRRGAGRASARTSLTPFVGDANIETPEYKAFLVNIEPIPGPVA